MPVASLSILLSSGCTKLEDIEWVSMQSESDELLCSSFIVSSLVFGRAKLLCVDTRDSTLEPNGMDFPDLNCIWAMLGLSCLNNKQVFYLVERGFNPFECVDWCRLLDAHFQFNFCHLGSPEILLLCFTRPLT